MENLTNKTVGAIVAENFRAAAIFQKHQIDFCCKGNIPLHEACVLSEANEAEVLREIGQVLLEKEAASNDYNNWPLDLLADYIEKKHHRFVLEQIPVIKGFLDKIVNVHGGRHPELAQVRALFNQSADELSHHMVKEERILFPSVKEMIQARVKQEPYAPFFGTIKNPVAVMMSEHENEGDRFREISRLTHNYTPPADACTTYRVAFESLKEFEKDLHTHIHLENNILFPKALEMEEKISLN
jgi:regulator of cell morphogenesis and NO signaling